MLKTVFIYLTTTLLCGSAVAQIKSDNQILHFNERNKLSFLSPISKKSFSLIQQRTSAIWNFNTSYVFNLEKDTPKGAIFCRMENKCRDKLNIWLMIHAGDEEAYRISAIGY